MKAPPHRRRRGLFWRFYLTGLAVLLVFGLAVGAAARFVEHDPPMRGAVSLATLIAADLAPLRAEPARLQARLDELHRLLEIDLAVYAAGRGLMAAAGRTPPPLDAADARGLTRARWLHAGHRPVLAAPFGAGAPPAEYLVVAWRGHSALWGLSTVLAGVLLALALILLPAAHLVARPLERITEAARALGAGDLSARTGVRRRDEIGALAGAFDEMAARVQGLVRSERELLANVSHEFRTPLSRIRVALELAEEERGDPEAVRRRLSAIDADLAELERLVGDLLTATRLELSAAGGPTAELTLRREPLSPNVLLREAADRFRARHPGRALDLSVADGLPPLDADPALVRRVLDNLLDNARACAEPGAPIEIVARAADGAVAIEVLDRGIGVDPADLPRLFDPFFRTDRSRSRVKGGVGLGLTLCKRIVEAHGGTIRAAIRDGGGMTFCVSLPRA